jgi:hypothetical protein
MFDNVARSIVEGDYIQALIQAVFAVISGLITIILYPFSILISTFIPDLDQGLAAIAEMFNYAATYIGWIMNAFAIPGVAIALISSYYLFTFTVSLGTWGIKLVLAWKKALFT